jgi:hypothetical protein
MARVLTQRGVDGVRPRSRRHGLRDGLVPGLQLLTEPTGHKSFALFVRIHGKQVNCMSAAPASSPWRRRATRLVACWP